MGPTNNTNVINNSASPALMLLKIKIPLSEILLKTKKPSGTINIDYSSKNEKFLIKIMSHKKKIKLST